MNLIHLSGQNHTLFVFLIVPKSAEQKEKVMQIPFRFVVFFHQWLLVQFLLEKFTEYSLVILISLGKEVYFQNYSNNYNQKVSFLISTLHTSIESIHS